MADPTPDLDERLARLAARKAGAGPSASKGTTTSATTGATDTPAPARTRHKHPAAAARILSLGLSSSAFFSIIGAFGEPSATHASNSASARVTRPSVPAARPTIHTKVVVNYIHHVLYVDRYGRPIPAPSVPTGAAAVRTRNGSAAGSAPPRSAAPAWNVPPAAVPSTAPATPPPASGPAPTTLAVTPAPTTPPTPAPRPTPPPVVVTTPPPPPPPACSGTTCP